MAVRSVVRSSVTQVPSGSVVVVLFCDVSDLKGLTARFGADWPSVVDCYQSLVGSAIERNQGHIEDGDATSFFGTFLGADGATQAVRAAVEIQAGLRNMVWPGAAGIELQAGIGLHAGNLDRYIFVNKYSGPRFVGVDVHRGARVKAAGRAGQVLVSAEVRSLVSDTEFTFEDLGFHRLRDFPESVRLFNLVVFDDRRAEFFGPPEALDFRPTNLTADDRLLLGREELIAKVRATFLNDGRRLVTFTGPGGVGKTRVAIASGSELLDEYRGGVWLVRAENLRKAQELLPAIAAVMNVVDVPGSDLLDALVDRLDAAPILLVLDNLEQLSGVGDVISELVDRTVSLRVLATSQTPLRVSGEAVLAVPVLELDDAVELFGLGAQSANVALDLDDPEIKRTVVDLIERLDRLPLAIELAAAQLRVIPLTELARGLQAQLELQVAQRGKPERQQSLHAVIDWSIQALPTEARKLFTRLGVFTGVTTLELIEEVCGRGIDVLEAAATLVDFSLLRRVDIGFGMPPAIQATAAQMFKQSAEAPELRRVHAVSMTALSVPLIDCDRINSEASKQATALDRNFSSAVHWARENDAKLYLSLVMNLHGWWSDAGKARIALQEHSNALKVNGISDFQRAQLLGRRASFLVQSGEQRKATVDIQEGMRLLNSGASDSSAVAYERANMLSTLALCQAATNVREAAASLETAIGLFRENDQLDRLLYALCLQAQMLIQAGDLLKAQATLEQATTLVETRAITLVSRGLSTLSNIKGDWALAVGQHLNALEFFSTALANEIAAYLIVYHTAGAVVALDKLGRFDAVIELLIALESAAQEVGAVFDRLSSDPEWPHTTLMNAREALDPNQLAEAEARGRKLSSGQLATRALALANETLEANGIEPIQLAMGKR